MLNVFLGVPSWTPVEVKEFTNLTPWEEITAWLDRLIERAEAGEKINVPLLNQMLVTHVRVAVAEGRLSPDNVVIWQQPSEFSRYEPLYLDQRGRYFVNPTFKFDHYSNYLDRLLAV